MNTIPSFDATQAKLLQTFLDAPDRSPDSMGYAETAGFLFAVACAPELVEPSEWLPIVIDPDNAPETNVENMRAITLGLMSLYNEMTRQVQTDDVKLPQDVTFFEDSMANFDSGASISQWARGFKTGYTWLEEMWLSYTPEEIKQEFEHQLLVLFFFSQQEIAIGLIEKLGNEDLTIEAMAGDMKRLFPEAQRGVAVLGSSIHQALASRGHNSSEPHGPKKKKVGRNDPCPCGSGNKFKKCCG